MKALLFAAVLACCSISFAQSAPSSALERCASDLSNRLFTIVKETVGLHNTDQVKAVLDVVKLDCLDHQGLAAKEGLSQKDAMELINTAVGRSFLEVFGK